MGYFFTDLPGRVKNLKNPDKIAGFPLCPCDNTLIPWSVDKIKEDLRTYLEKKSAKIEGRSKKKRLSNLLEAVGKTLSDAAEQGQRLNYCRACHSVYFIEKSEGFYKNSKKITQDEKTPEVIIAKNSIKISKEEADYEREQIKDMRRSLYSN